MKARQFLAVNYSFRHFIIFFTGYYSNVIVSIKYIDILKQFYKAGRYFSLQIYY